MKAPIQLDKAQTVRECQLAEAENGVSINAKTKLPFTDADPCVQYGVTLAFDEKAFTNVRKAVKDFLTALLKP